MPSLSLTFILTVVAATFTGRWGGSMQDFAYDLVETPEEGFLLVGRTDSDALGGSDAWLICTDASGDSIWSRKYGGDGPDWAYSIIPASAGGYLVTGRFGSTPSGDLDGWLLRLDANGETLWSRNYGGTGTQTFFSSIESPDGGFVSTGFRAGTGFDLWVHAVDSLGVFEWETVLGGTSDDCGYGIAPGSDGFVVAGQTLSYGAGGGDLWAIRFDWGGDSLSSLVLGGTEFDYPWSICEIPSGGHAISCTSRSFGAGSYDFWIVRLDDDLGVQWAEAYGYAEDDWCYNSSPAGSDGLVVTGMRNRGVFEAWLLRLDSAGDTLWTRTYDTPGLTNRGLGTIQSSDGGYALCGAIAEGPDEDFWLVKADQDGYCPETGIESPEGPSNPTIPVITPNPSAGRFAAIIPGHDGSPVLFDVFDVSGRLIYSGSTPPGPAGATGEISIDEIGISGPGVFLLRLPSLGSTPLRVLILED